MVKREVRRALREYGLRYNVRKRRWEGFDYFLPDGQIEELRLNEVEQVLAGVRDRVPSVRLGPDRVFKICWEV